MSVSYVFKGRFSFFWVPLCAKSDPPKFDPGKFSSIFWPFALHPHNSYSIALQPHSSVCFALHPHNSFSKAIHPHNYFFYSSPSELLLVCKKVNTWVKFRSSHSQFFFACKNLKTWVKFHPTPPTAYEVS